MGGVLIYFSVRGRAAEQGIIFRIPTQVDSYHFCKNRLHGLHDRVHMGSIWSFLTRKRCSWPFALREYDLNRLDGNISTFSDRFLTNFQGRVQFC